jgi:hypothetical protein
MNSNEHDELLKKGNQLLHRAIYQEALEAFDSAICLVPESM